MVEVPSNDLAVRTYVYVFCFQNTDAPTQPGPRQRIET